MVTHGRSEGPLWTVESAAHETIRLATTKRLARRRLELCVVRCGVGRVAVGMGMAVAFYTSQRRSPARCESE